MNAGVHFAQLLRLVASLSRNYTESSVSSLLTWRRTMNPFSEFSSAELLKRNTATSKEFLFFFFFSFNSFFIKYFPFFFSKSVIRKGPEEFAQDERQGVCFFFQ